MTNEIVVTNTDTGTPGASDNTMPATADNSANTTEATSTATGELNTSRGGRGDQQRHHQQRADDLDALRRDHTDQRGEHDAQCAHRNPRAAATSGSAVANNSGR